MEMRWSEYSRNIIACVAISQGGDGPVPFFFNLVFTPSWREENAYPEIFSICTANFWKRAVKLE